MRFISLPSKGVNPSDFVGFLNTCSEIDFLLLAERGGGGGGEGQKGYGATDLQSTSWPYYNRQLSRGLFPPPPSNNAKVKTFVCLWFLGEGACHLNMFSPPAKNIPFSTLTPAPPPPHAECAQAAINLTTFRCPQDSGAWRRLLYAR